MWRVMILLLLLAGSGTASAALGDHQPGRTRFLPVMEAYQPIPRIEGHRLVIDWAIAPGYYLYRHGFKSPLPLVLPAGEAHHDEYFGDVEIYHDRVEVQLALPPDAPATIAQLSFQGCADAGLCYPPETLHWRVDTRTGTAEPVTPPLAASPVAVPANPDKALLTVLAFAFLGGILLNLMPCVFPVLGLKVIAITSHAHRGSTLGHAFSYTAGVILSFLAVATVLLILRAGGQAIGWGFQLQSPAVIAGLAWLFTGITITLAGGFSPGLRWLGVGQSLTEGSGPGASFFTGMLAVVVASPCTVPFMAAAVGYALLQPAATTLAVFACLGLGMAAPFILLGLLPGLAARLPRPGPWMETLKHVLAIPMAVTVGWLFWVLSHQVPAATVLWVASGCAVLAGSLYLAEKTRWRAPALGLALASLLVLVATPAQVPGGTADRNIEADIASLRNRGQAVLLNVTADWCITCLANERAVLGTEATRQLLQTHGVTYRVADWTRPNPAISRLLARFGRSGVPLYVFYPADPAKPPVTLPQLLTYAELERVIASNSGENAGKTP